MITQITGTINRVLDEDLRLQVGPLEYQVLVPECVRRQLQLRVGQEVTLHTSEYLEGNQMSGRMVPRLIGFTSEAELEFFDLFCTVEKIGVKKALKALARPIKEIADAIQRQDSKWLTTLPGIGVSSSEQIVATLRRKVMRFALMPAATVAVDGTTAPPPPAELAQTDVLADAYNALVHVGHSPADARDMLDKATTSGKTFNDVEEVLKLIYSKSK
jgi:Holliday junction DNA helicase RuvA